MPVLKKYTVASGPRRALFGARPQGNSWGAGMQQEHRCAQCRDSEQAHDQAMEEYIELIDRQSRLFRQGHRQEAKELDAVIYWMKARRETAMNALLHHQADHWQRGHSLSRWTCTG